MSQPVAREDGAVHTAGACGASTLQRPRGTPGYNGILPFADMTNEQQRQYFLDRTTPEPNTGCWLWLLCTNRDGYGLAFVPSRKGTPAHKLAFQVWNGRVPDGMVVCHKCDTPLCCNPAHLFLGTAADNMQDMVQKGRTPVGRDTSAKLTPDRVRRLREQFNEGIPMRRLAQMFGVARTTVRMVVRKDTWKDVS